MTLPQVDLEKTICAIATPRGHGGLGVVRLSGPSAVEIANQMFRGNHPLLDQKGYTVHHGVAIDPSSGEQIDEVIVTLFRSPKSFSGEDLVEFSAHGGPVVLDQVLHVMAANGATLASPGEFTLRAFLNGRIDLTEAEAVADLISAKTEESAAAALKQLKGGLHNEVTTLRGELLGGLARLEIDVDFTDENIDPAETNRIADMLDRLTHRISHLLASYHRGRILREGFTVVLAGPPNSGKSTLFNRIAQDERAIVTEIPGTTRDILREFINLKGWPVCLVDTAGLRETIDVVERIGVERSTQAVGGADAVLWLIDMTSDWEDQLPAEPVLETGVPICVCLNKCDTVALADTVLAEIKRAILLVMGGHGHCVLAMSAKTGLGIDELLQMIHQWIGSSGIDHRQADIAINERHRDALAVALDALNTARATLAGNGESELIAFDLRHAANALGEIIGVTTTEQVLGEIFGSFCIGK